MEVKLEFPYKGWSSIVFNRDDFKIGDAYKVIDAIKSLPKGDYFYSKKNKKWYVKNEYIEELRRIVYRRPEEDFDVDKWIQEVFNGNKDKSQE